MARYLVTIRSPSRSNRCAGRSLTTEAFADRATGRSTMSDETDYFDWLQRMGLTIKHPPQFHESRISRLLQAAHARAWFVACIPDHAPDEWQLFVDVWRM